MNFSSAARVLGQGVRGRPMVCLVNVAFHPSRSVQPAFSRRLISMGAARLSAAAIQTDKLVPTAREDFTSPFLSQSSLVHTTNLTETPELGLSSGWPSGWLQTLMELLHIDLGLPWWQVIGLTTICLRICIFPIVIIAQRNMVMLNNHQPTIQKLQIKQQLASIRGNVDESRFASTALNNYMMTNNCHPVKSLFPLMAQASFFMSMFFALRGMTTAPVPSMASGGLFWFTDLTLADPFYILPVVTASTIYLQLYLSADGLNTSTMPPFMKKLIYVMPLISLPIMIQFPAALNMYWLTNNIISVIQARVVRHPTIRQKLNIGEMVQWKPEDLPLTGFYEEMKRELALAKSRQEKKEETVRREKEERAMEEAARRTKLLASLAEEDRARMEAKKGFK